MKKCIGLFLIGLAFLVTGCASTGDSLIGSAKPILGNDYYGAGKTAGETGVFAYQLIKDDEKYADIVKECEKIYEQIDSQDTEVTLGTINKVGIELGRAALATRYGYARSTMIITAVQIGGTVIDRIIANRVDTVAASQFLAGFKEGVDIARANFPADISVPAETPEKKPFECPDGNCKVTISNHKVSHQMAVAQELIDGKYVTAEDPDDADVTKFDNVTHFIERCKVLKKFNVKKTDLYIKSFVCEGGKLKSIEFKMILDDGAEFDVSCVGCMDIPEIAEK